MYFERQNVIFIHAPKTGGNYFTRAFVKYSSDRIVAARQKRQDGINGFGVEGEYTLMKHQGLADYAAALGDRMRGSRVYSIFRPPVERLVSLYFSPHRWMRTAEDGTFETVPAESIAFDPSAFAALIKRSPPIWQLLDATSCPEVPALGRPGRHASGAEIRLLDFRNLRGDLESLAQDLRFSAPEFPADPVNASTRPDLVAELIAPDSPAARAVLASAHARDAEFFSIAG